VDVRRALARAYATIANGGRLITPRIGRRVLDATGRPLKSLVDDAPSRPLGVAPDTLDALRDGLRAAANSPDGTSTAVFGSLPPEARVAGKTGTAENETGVDHSWYVGYAPADDPRIVVAVVIEQGGQGANAAAPAACQAITTFLRAGRGSCGAGARAN
jgi:penicillin-binding protein 2